jgi:hypothetical protein
MAVPGGIPPKGTSFNIYRVTPAIRYLFTKDVSYCVAVTTDADSSQSVILFYDTEAKAIASTLGSNDPNALLMLGGSDFYRPDTELVFIFSIRATLGGKTLNRFVR